MRSATANKKTLRLLSLFSGCGGMDLGFEGGFEVHNSLIPQSWNRKPTTTDWSMLPHTSFQTVFANDILPDAQYVWQNFFCKKYQYTPDIFHLSSIVDLVNSYEKGTFCFPHDIDIVTGGFPCQDFSVAGKRKGFDSHRNHMGELIANHPATLETRGRLYMWMKKVIEITLPKIFIAENVKGLVSLDNVKDIIQQDFSQAGGDGYLVLPPRVLHAAKYGVPQTRERVFFIGIRKSALHPKALKELSQQSLSPMYDPYPPETHSYPDEGNSIMETAVSLRGLLGSVKEPQESVDPSQRKYSKAKYMGRNCQGQTEINLDGVSPTIRSEHHGNIEFRRLSKEHGGKNIEELELGLIERRLTPRECALIQTFPYNYDFVIPDAHHKNRYVVSPSSAYKLIGNAVPPLLAYHMAIRLEKIWSLYFI